MSDRLSRITPDEMTPEQTEIYAKFTGGKRAAPGSSFSLLHPEGGLIGPPNAWLLSPPLARVFERIGWTMRFDLQLSDRAREIAILLVAFHRDGLFELYAHRGAGRAAGLDDAEYADTVAGLGERTLFELVALVGHYDQVATQLSVFGVKPPDDGRPAR